ncbi:MAG: hypothetical protein Q4C10_12000, partial [Clostridia bacterium]|nr:hypothetical protein [Clostridia bacterium]
LPAPSSVLLPCRYFSDIVSFEGLSFFMRSACKWPDGDLKLAQLQCIQWTQAGANRPSVAAMPAIPGFSG